MENLKLAWRNLWRNKRRTLITVASVFFALIFAITMRSMQLGTYDNMFKNVIESYTGYIQIQHNDFWDDKTIDNLVKYSEELNNTILENDNVDITIKRLESFALASNGNQSKGVLVLGIEPSKEKYLSSIEEKLVKFRLTENAVKKLKESDIPQSIKDNLDLFPNHSYSTIARLQFDLEIDDEILSDILPVFNKYASFKSEYLELGKDQIMAGDKLAKYLNLTVGDSLILLSQGYHGTSAAGKYLIKGIVKMPSPEIDGRVVFLPLDVCQELYNAHGMVSSIALHLENINDKYVQTTTNQLNEALEGKYTAISWRKMNELLIQQMDADDKSGLIMIFILYLVIAFGVFGTVLMMVAERRREFGVLLSIGMQRSKLIIIITIEMILMGITGILAGVVVTIPTIIYGFYNPYHFTGEMAKIYEDYGMEPVMMFKWFDDYYLTQIMVVFLIVMIALIYPIQKIIKLKEIQALKA